MTKVAYQEPIDVADAGDCYFYHSLELPGVGLLDGDWDLRGCIDDYLGRRDLAGKRALDVGTASGFLSFEMEKRGADVVSFDMPDSRSWNVVPNVRSMANRNAIREGMRATHEGLRNGYWFAHRRLESKVRAFYGDVYDLPTELGSFDVVVFGMILGHLRDPLAAMASAARLCRGHIVISDLWMPEKRSRGRPVARLQPSLENGIIDCWWQLSVAAAEQFLGVLGFRVIDKVDFKATRRADGKRVDQKCISVVAERVEG